MDSSGVKFPPPEKNYVYIPVHRDRLTDKNVVNESTTVCSLHSLALNNHTFKYTHTNIQTHLHTQRQTD